MYGEMKQLCKVNYHIIQDFCIFTLIVIVQYKNEFGNRGIPQCMNVIMYKRKISRDKYHKVLYI